MANSDFLENINGVVVASNKVLADGVTDFYISVPEGMHGGGRITIQVVYHSGGTSVGWDVDEVAAPYRRQSATPIETVYDAYEWLTSGLTLTTGVGVSTRATIADRNVGALRIRATAVGTPTISIYCNRG